MKKIATISAIIENPKESQNKFNEVVSTFNGIVKGRMGIPFQEENIAIVSIVVIGELDEINHLTGKLGKIPHVSVKTGISKKEIQ